MFTVTLSGGSPWGFRIEGGKQAHSPVIISRLNACGKAAQQGVREGDVVMAINGHPVEGLSQTQAHQIIKDAGNTLPLTLSREPPSAHLETKLYKSYTTIEVKNGHTSKASSSTASSIAPTPPEHHQKTCSTTSLNSSSSSTSSTGSCSTTIVVSPNRQRTSPLRVRDLPPVKNIIAASPSEPLPPELSKDGGETSQWSHQHQRKTESPKKEVHYQEQGADSSRQVLSLSSSPRHHPPPLNVKVSCNVRKGSPGPVRPNFKATAVNPVWSPGQLQPQSSMDRTDSQEESSKEDKENLSPVWQPFGPLDDKPTFKSVQLDISNKPTSPQPTASEISSPSHCPKPQPAHHHQNSAYANSSSSQPVQPPPSNQTEKERKPSSPATSPVRIGVSSGLVQYQNPTITLLQKAREGQLPKGAIYIDQHVNSEDEIPKDAVLVDQRVTVEGDQIHTDSYYALPTSQEISSRRVTTIKAPEKYEGIGPTEKGIPISLRTGVKEEYASDWYKTMFKSLHKFDKPTDDYQTIRYGKKVGRVPHSGGYMSEPELERDDYPYSNKYATIDHRRQQRVTTNRDTKQNSVPPSSVSSQQLRFNMYHNQPRSIAEYEPGHSSIAEREVRLDDTGDVTQQSTRYLPSATLPKLNYIDGYESDSTLIRKTGKSNSLDPQQQKAWYREVQKGGDIPFSGLGKLAPDRPKFPLMGPAPPLPCYTEADFLSALAREQVSPHRYQETEVNIHYRTPVRSLEKEFIEEEELRKRQETAMKKFYEEERYKKQMQQIQEIEMRRHGDNFMPSQKSPIPLNRYDEPFEMPKSPLSKTPEPRSMAKVLYNFYAQTGRELSLTKDDIIYIIKKVDKNWYEGEHHGTVGIFPVSYVEVIAVSNSAPDGGRRSHEGHGRAKYNFKAQTPVELSLFKGETVILSRKVDDNWFEGHIGSKKGIFPAAYIEVLSFPGDKNDKEGRHSAVNGSHSARQAFKTREAFSNYPASSQSTSHESYSLSSIDERKQPLTESLHVDTHTEPIPYRALYTYRPQNEDELELKDGDTVYVMEKCDDGWFVGTSLRTGLFGTFPGNYVERI